MSDRRYRTARWLRLRGHQLYIEPLCQQCKKKGLHIAAEVVHHKVPHRGDAVLFWTGELESLCAACHNHHTSMVEKHGYSNAIGTDGWPIDKRHPVYAHT